MFSDSSIIIQALNQRQATKQFNPDYVLEGKHMDALIDSINLAPTSFGLQPFKLLQIQNKELRKQIQQISWNQAQVTEASELLVWAVEQDLSVVLDRYAVMSQALRNYTKEDTLRYTDFISEFIAVRELESNNFYFQWAARQAYISLGFALQTCALLGIDCCPMEGFDKNKLDILLELPEKKLNSVVMLAVGKKSSLEKTSVKIRLNKTDLLKIIK